MTDELKHTPTPWKFSLSIERDFLGIYPDTGKKEAPIAKMPEYIRKDVMAANAEFIVRAVNSHDEMLAALQDAESAISASISYYGTDAALSALKSVRAAISKAIGASPADERRQP